MSPDILNAIVNTFIQVSTIAAVCIVIYLVAWKPLQAMLDKRASTIVKDVEDAQAGNNEAQQLKVEARQKLQEIQANASNIINDAKQMAQKLQEDADVNLKADMRKRQDEFDKQLVVEKQRVKAEMQAQVLELSITVAKNYMEETVTQADTQERMAALTEKLVNANE